MRSRVFVVMPYRDRPLPDGRKLDFDAVFTELLAPALTKAGTDPFRADKEVGAGDIRTDMMYELVTADYVVADLSLDNPNVYYELGVRHGIAPNGTVVVCGVPGKRPFDVAPDRCFSYDGDLFVAPITDTPERSLKLADAVAKLAKVFSDAFAADGKGRVGSPVFSHLPGLTPADWSTMTGARAKYFNCSLDEWRLRLDAAKREHQVGDILTLADEAPTATQARATCFHAAKALIDLRRYDQAKDLLEPLIDRTDPFPEVLSQYGLVLGRLGDVEGALAHMADAAKRLAGHPEAQGILGRAYKDLWRIQWQDLGSEDERIKVALNTVGRGMLALGAYALAFSRNPGNFYNGVNVAALICQIAHIHKRTGTKLEWPEELSGAAAKAVPVLTRQTALWAYNRHKRDAASGQFTEDLIWSAATLGELSVIDNVVPDTAKRYGEAANDPRCTRFMVESMLTQLNMYRALGINPGAVAAAEQAIHAAKPGALTLAKPWRNVLMFSGHRTDAPSRSSPRFPEAKAGKAAEQIASFLAEWDVGPGDLAICGGARGGDILFAEACLARGAKVRMLLARKVEPFISDSVEYADWIARFRALLPKCEVAEQPDRLGPPTGGESPHSRNNRWILNMAASAGRTGQLYALLLWDGKSEGDGPGGTAHFVTVSDRAGAHPEIIDPATL